MELQPCVGVSSAAMTQKNRVSHAGVCIFLSPSCVHISAVVIYLPSPFTKHISISPSPASLVSQLQQK